MKYIKMIDLAVKYLFRYRRRYLFLFIAMGFGFFLITFITSLKDGMTENVYLSAQSHYAGDLIVAGFDAEIWKYQRIQGMDTKTILNDIHNTDLDPERIIYRTTYDGKGTVYYNGTGILLKYVTGVDWENEKDFFENLTYQSPPIEPFDIDENTIVLSSPVAEELGVRVGDSVILQQPTINWHINTHVFVVRAIIEDTSIFGYYKAFVSRKTLNSVIGFDENACTSIGLYFNDRRAISEKERILYNALSKSVQMGPLISDRDEFTNALNENWTGRLFFVLSLGVYLSEVEELLAALNLITYFLYVVMLLIIFVSASVTYRLILYERTREIGTMMALGFYGGDIRFILLLETLFLGIISLVAGFLLAAIVGWGMSIFQFTSIPSFDIFTKDGNLIPLYQFRTTMNNVIAVFCILLPAVWFPVYRSSKSALPEMLSGGMKS
jgi:ABC-type lipoprotein release transport system permease subunit